MTVSSLSFTIFTCGCVTLTKQRCCLLQGNCLNTFLLLNNYCSVFVGLSRLSNLPQFGFWVDLTLSGADMVPRSNRMDTVRLMDMDNSKFRIMLVAQFNLVRIIRVLEILYHQTTLAEIKHGWPLLYSFFVLRIVPLFLGCILIYSVYQDNRDGCMMWCAGEIGVVFGYLALVFLSTPLKTWEDNDILVFTYCMLRFASIMLVFDYIEQLDIFLDQEEREKETGLRNHFWHQLALLHAENALAKEKAVEQENTRETPLSEDSQKDKDI